MGGGKGGGEGGGEEEKEEGMKNRSEGERDKEDIDKRADRGRTMERGGKITRKKQRER